MINCLLAIVAAAAMVAGPGVAQQPAYNQYTGQPVSTPPPPQPNPYVVVYRNTTATYNAYTSAPVAVAGVAATDYNRYTAVGTATAGAARNPYTGAAAREEAYHNPYTGGTRSAAAYHNPATGTTAAGETYHNS